MRRQKSCFKDLEATSIERWASSRFLVFCDLDNGLVSKRWAAKPLQALSQADCVGSPRPSGQCSRLVNYKAMVSWMLS